MSLSGLKKYGEFLDTLPDAALLVDRDGKIVFANAQVHALLDYQPRELIHQPVQLLVPVQHREAHAHLMTRYLANPGLRAMGTRRDLHARRRDGREIPVQIMLAPRPIGRAVVLCLVRDITDLSEMQAALIGSEERYRHLVENASDVFYAVEVGTDAMRGQVRYMSRGAEAITGCRPHEFVHDSGLWARLIHPEDLAHVADVTREVLTSHQARSREYRLRHTVENAYHWVEDRVVPRYDASGQCVGYQGTARDITERKGHQQHLETLVALGATLRAARSRAELVQILLDELLALFDANGSAFAVCVRGENELVIDLGRGVLSAWTLRRLPSDDAVTGQVMSTGVPYLSNTASEGPCLNSHGLPPEVRAVACVPVQANHTIAGALIVVKGSMIVDREVQLLRAIGEMVAAALQRLVLQEQTLQDAIELAEAHEATIEGWARLLDRRDDITEGHTKRVTDMTLLLARQLGVEEAQLPHIRRGAILHDIGKMVVPDRILHKQGPLDEDERAIMCTHAECAYEILWPIEFLRPALDIPYYHHERWDGTGYPWKLKDEAIPLAARIFAVAHAYDAITNNRPYAVARTHSEALDLIVAQSGHSFDPQVVEGLLTVTNSSRVNAEKKRSITALS